jgi:hypothetical protein
MTAFPIQYGVINSVISLLRDELIAMDLAARSSSRINLKLHGQSET